jgi:hypothetical protein
LLRTCGLQGLWKYPANPGGMEKDNSLRFKVTAVNDRKLAKPVEFNIARIRARTEHHQNAIPEYEHLKDLVGVAWTLNAYETGRFSASPSNVAKPYWNRTFTSEVVGTVVP